MYLIFTFHSFIISCPLLCVSGVTHVITMDLHHKEIQGFFDVPVDNLRASPFLVQYIQEHVSTGFRS